MALFREFQNPFPLTRPRTYLQNPHFKMKRSYLDDETYAKAIESFVVVDADTLLVNQENQTIILLARRRHKPMQGLWMIGGRIFAGEDEVLAIQRVFQRETSLAIDADRFHFIGMHRYIWSEREQAPQSAGSDNLCYNFALALTSDEIATVASHLDPEEYDLSAGLQEFGREDLLANGGHQAILDLYDALFPFVR
jgi:hypothetical protein